MYKNYLRYHTIKEINKSKKDLKQLYNMYLDTFYKNKFNNLTIFELSRKLNMNLFQLLTETKIISKTKAEHYYKHITTYFFSNRTYLNMGKIISYFMIEGSKSIYDASIYFNKSCRKILNDLKTSIMNITDIVKWSFFLNIDFIFILKCHFDYIQK